MVDDDDSPITDGPGITIFGYVVDIDVIRVVILVIGLFAAGVIWRSIEPVNAPRSRGVEFQPLSQAICDDISRRMTDPLITRYVRFDGRGEITVAASVWGQLERDVRARIADLAAGQHGCNLDVNPAAIEVTVRSAATGQVIEQKQLWEFY